jgi:hypothetical protein
MGAEAVALWWHLWHFRSISCHFYAQKLAEREDLCKIFDDFRLGIMQNG